MLNTIAFIGVPSGFYIYLGCLCGSDRSGYKPGEHNKHYASHGPHYDLGNACTNYVWFSFLNDYNKIIPRANIIWYY